MHVAANSSSYCAGQGQENFAVHTIITGTLIGLLIMGTKVSDLFRRKKAGFKEDSTEAVSRSRTGRISIYLMIFYTYIVLPSLVWGLINLIGITQRKDKDSNRGFHIFLEVAGLLVAVLMLILIVVRLACKNSTISGFALSSLNSTTEVVSYLVILTSLAFTQAAVYCTSTA